MQNVNLNKYSTNVENKVSHNTAEYDVVDHEMVTPQQVC